MIPSSQSWSTSRSSARQARPGSRNDQAPANTSRRGSLANGIITNPHATPPRHTGPRPLPDSSPSTDRLRRIAPAPLRLVPRPRIEYAPGPAVPAVLRRRPGSRRPISFDLRAVDDVTRPEGSLDGDPVEWSQGLQQYLTSQSNDGSQTPGSSNVRAVPILNDIDGRLSRRMQKLRAATPNAAAEDDHIPSELQEPEYLRVEPQTRIGAERMTPARYQRATYVPEVLVNFDTDVFSPRFDRAPIIVNDTHDPHDRTPSPDANILSMRNASIDSYYTRAGSSTSSFYAPERRDTDLSAYRFPAADPSTLPVHNETYHAISTPSRVSLEHHQLEPALAPSNRIDSSDTIFSGLITPTHVPTPLPPQSPESRTYAPPKKLRFKGKGRASTEEVQDDESQETRGLQLTSSRASIDSEHERAIEDAGGTPGRNRSRATKTDKPPPVPAIPLSYGKPPVLHVTASLFDFVLSESEPVPNPEPEPMVEESKPKVTIADPISEDLSWPEDLRKFDRETFVEIHVDQADGPSYCVRMPFRRMTKPEFWRNKEDETLIRSCRLKQDPPRVQPFQQTGAVIFGQHSRGRDSWYLEHPDWCSKPVLHAITANEDYTKSLTDHVELDIKKAGIHHAYGHDEYGEVQWMFEYLVKSYHTAATVSDDEMLGQGRHIFPICLYATTSFLKDPRTREKTGYVKEGFSERATAPKFHRRPSTAPIVPTTPIVPVASKRSPPDIPLLRVSSEPISLTTKSSPEQVFEHDPVDRLAVEAPTILRSQSEEVVSYSDTWDPPVVEEKEKEKENVAQRTLGAIGRVLNRQRPNTPASSEMKANALQAAQAAGVPWSLGPEQDIPTKSHGGILGIFKLGSRSKSGSRPSSARAHSPLSSVMSASDDKPDPDAAPPRAVSPAPSLAPNTSGTSFLRRFTDSKPDLSAAPVRAESPTPSLAPTTSSTSFLHRLGGKGKGKAKSSSRPGSSRAPSPQPLVLDESANVSVATLPQRPGTSGNKVEAPVKRTRSNSLLAKLVRPFTPPHVFTPDKDSPPVPPLPQNVQNVTPTPLRSVKGIKSLSSLNPNTQFKPPILPPRPPPVPALPKSATAAVFSHHSHSENGPNSRYNHNSRNSRGKHSSHNKIVLAQDTPEIRRMHPFLTQLQPLPPPIPGSTWTHLNPQPTHVLVPVRPISATPERSPPRLKRPKEPRPAYVSDTRPTSSPSHLRALMPRAPAEPVGTYSGPRPPPRRLMPARRPSTTDTGPI